MTNIKTYSQFVIKILLVIIFTTFSITYANPSKSIFFTDEGHGTPLVLIHAFPTDQRLWASQQEGLIKYFRVITLDLWGFGHSSASDGDAITMTEYADEVKEVLDKLQIQKAIIVGESMGGYIALAFVKHNPDRVQGLILSDTQSIADSVEAKAKREKTAQDVLANGSAQFIRDFMPKALSANASDETRADLKNILDSQAVTGIASALRGMALREDTTSVLGKINFPVLIMTGENDALISPVQSQNMCAVVKGCKLVVIADAGHLSSLEQPEKWNQAVIDSFIMRK